MHNSNIPTDRELPTTSQLIKSTIIAATVAILLLITIVLPAEYGIDPTKAGQLLGLKKMGEVKMSLAKEVEADQNKHTDKAPVQVPAVSAKVPSVEVNSDTMSIILAPNQGKEIKAVMKAGKTVTYSWKSNGSKVNFDVHADSRKLKIDYHKYVKGVEAELQGSITAAFDGQHGWYWRNRTDSPVTITLEVSGECSDLILYE